MATADFLINAKAYIIYQQLVHTTGFYYDKLWPMTMLRACGRVQQAARYHEDETVTCNIGQRLILVLKAFEMLVTQEIFI